MATLIERAEEIRDAQQIGENTAERVGGVLVDLAAQADEDRESLGSQLSEVWQEIATMRETIHNFRTTIYYTQEQVTKQAETINSAITNADKNTFNITKLSERISALEQQTCYLGEYSTVLQLEEALVNKPAPNETKIYFGVGGGKGAVCLSVSAPSVGDYGGWTQLILLDAVLRARRIYLNEDGSERTAEAWSPI